VFDVLTAEVPKRREIRSAAAGAFAPGSPHGFAVGRVCAPLEALIAFARIRSGSSVSSRAGQSKGKERNGSVSFGSTLSA
jgi:hypothetical protein